MLPIQNHRTNNNNNGTILQLTIGEIDDRNRSLLVDRQQKNISIQVSATWAAAAVGSHQCVCLLFSFRHFKLLKP